MKWINVIGMTLEFLSFWFLGPEILGDKRLSDLEEWLERSLKSLSWTGLALVAVLMLLSLVTLPASGPIGMIEMLDEYSISVGQLTLYDLGFTAVLLAFYWGLALIALIGTRFVLQASSGFASRVARIAAKLAYLAMLALLGSALLVLALFLVSTAVNEAEWILLIPIAVAAISSLVIVALEVANAANWWAWLVSVLAGASAIIVLMSTFEVKPGAIFFWFSLGFVVYGTFLALQTKVAPPLLRLLADDGNLRQRAFRFGVVVLVLGFVLQIGAAL